MSDQLIDDYLRDLRVSAWVRRLPKSETAELENETREKIAAELAAAGNRDEETVYGVLDRLGPAADIVGQKDATSPSGASSTLNSVLAPVARLQFRLAARGWGLAEFGGLLLLIAGPYLLWWVGPIFGIILIRSYADRWSESAEHNATVVVFGLLAIQTVIAALLVLVALANGEPLGALLQRVMSAVGPGPRSGFALIPPIDTTVYLGPLYIVQVIAGWLPAIAGLVAGVYLALSPRIRR